MSIQKIQGGGQQYCNVAMANNHSAGNHQGHGWEYSKPLLTYKLIARVSRKRSPLIGFRGPVDQIKLTNEGWQLIPKMFEKFSVGRSHAWEAGSA